MPALTPYADSETLFERLFTLTAPYKHYASLYASHTMLRAMLPSYA